MQMMRCNNPECGWTGKEDDLVFKQKHGEWQAVCPDCWAPVTEVDLCPICYSELEFYEQSFCRKCIRDGVKQLHIFCDELSIQGYDLDETTISKDDKDYFIQRIIEEA